MRERILHATDLQECTLTQSQYTILYQSLEVLDNLSSMLKEDTVHPFLARNMSKIGISEAWLERYEDVKKSIEMIDSQLKNAQTYSEL